jgi:hypothetical protein
MPLKGTAFLALWNDIEGSRDGEYKLWHTREHVPERVGIPGILSGRRYAAPDATVHRYFTLYELDSPAVLASPAYTQLVDNPTPWSRSMRPAFRNFLRYPCKTLLSLGQGMGGALATFRLHTAPAHIERLFAIETVLALHLGEADLSQPFPLQTAPVEQGPRFLLLVEANDHAALTKALPMIFSTVGATDAQIYELASAIGKDNLGGTPAPFTPPNR